MRTELLHGILVWSCSNSCATLLAMHNINKQWLQILDQITVALFRHSFEEHLLHGPRHGRQGGEAVGVFVESVHDSGHVKLDSLARRRHCCEPQHFVCQLLHGTVDRVLQMRDSFCLGVYFSLMLEHVEDSTHAAGEMHVVMVFAAVEYIIVENVAGEEERGLDNRYQCDGNLGNIHVLIEGGDVAGLCPFCLFEARREPSIPLRIHFKRCTLINLVSWTLALND